MKIKILYEDKNILAIDKPSGMMVHPDGRSRPARNAFSTADAGGEKTPNQNKFGTGQAITDWIIKNYPKLKGIGEPVKGNPLKNSQGLPLEEIDRPGIVHRLDKETSGVLLIMKTKKAFAYFKKQFMDREIKKTYYAVVSGWVKNDHDTINKPIGRSPKDFRRRLAGRGARGELREAITEYTVLKRFTSPQPSPYEGEGVKFTYLEVRPKTGRTHQIRVHMKFINHPVVNDSLYNPNKPHPKGFERLGLHAKSIEFKDLKGNLHKIESPLPKEFESMINKA